MATMKRISIQMPFSSAGVEFGCTASPPPTRAQTEKTVSISPTVSQTASPSRIYLSSTPGGVKSLRSGLTTISDMYAPPVTPYSEMTTTKSTRLFYYKTGSDERSADTKFYLTTGLRVRPPTSGRSTTRKQTATGESAPPASKPRSMWASGDTEHRLRLMDYHMAELSLHYRAGVNPNTSRSVHKEVDEEAEEVEEAEKDRETVIENEGNDEEDEKVSLPPPPSPLLPLSRPTSPSVSLGISETSRVPEPEELVHQSTSNRLLNYVSIDECPIKHRKARRRVRSPIKCRSNPAPDATSGVGIEISDDPFEGPSLNADSPVPHRLLGEPRNSILDRIDRLQGITMTSAGGGTSRVRRQFQKRNQLLRDQMNVYVAWRTSERLKERFDMMRGIHSAHSLLQANKEDRLKAFSAVLRQKELEYSTAVGSMSDMDSGTREGEGIDDRRLRPDIDDLGETPRGQENKLNQFWDVLQ